MLPDAAAPDAVLRYADHDDGVIDVHLPRSARSHNSTDAEAQLDGTGRASQRLIVLLHGGFWKTAYDRRHTRAMARALADEGFVVATPEYRRVGPGGAGGWPATGDDVRRAVEALPDLLAGLGVETGETVVTGHSAGGHLALWMASTDAPVDRVVALAPVCDLREAIRRGLGSDAARAFLDGIDPDEADPMLLLDRAPEARITIVHGVDDDTVPIALSRGLVQRHPWITLREVPGGHYEPIEPGSTAWPTVLEALTAK